MPPRSYLREFATLKAESTRHGPRPGLACAPWCTRGPPACHSAVSATGDRRTEEESFVFRKKSVFHAYAYRAVQT